jgi:hypothetical protein
VKAVVLSLFRRGEERREEYMFHRFLQVCQSRPWGACRVTVVYRGPRTCRCHWQMSADCPAFCTHRDARLTLARDATADPIPLTRARHFLPQRRPHYVLANDHDAMYRRSRL